jgi:hypothetical protein
MTTENESSQTPSPAFLNIPEKNSSSMELPVKSSESTPPNSDQDLAWRNDKITGPQKKYIRFIRNMLPELDIPNPEEIKFKGPAHDFIHINGPAAEAARKLQRLRLKEYNGRGYGRSYRK